MLNFDRLPEPYRHAIIQWIDSGVIPGGFLQAVIMNDLKQTLMFADEDAQIHLKTIVSFFMNEVPDSAWGSADNAARWHNHSGLRGMIVTASLSHKSFHTKRRLYLVQPENEADEKTC